MSDFSERLKTERIQRNLTQSAMAEMLGIKRSTYSLYEGGKREPNFNTLQKIADILCVTLDDLMGFKPIESSFPPGIKVHSIQEYKYLKNIFDGYHESPEDKEALNDFINLDGNNTLAVAVFGSDEYTSEELQEIERFADFVKSRRKTR